MYKKTSILIVFLSLFLSSPSLIAQENTGSISGSVEGRANFFIRDSVIGASNTPQYDRQLFGAETWMDIKYSNWGFDFGLRFDMFNNSNLLNPSGSYSDQGIGRWYIKKNLDKFDISVGYLYDQIGSGVIFRAYEERALAIDNALFGARVNYYLNDNWKIKGFTGRQKQQFSSYRSIIKGGSIEGYASIGNEEKPITFAPGIGVVNRTIDDETMNNLVSALATYTPIDRIGAKYNVYAYSLYNTMTAGNFSWYFEGAYKTNEVFFDPLETKTNWNGTTSAGKFVNENGYILYSSLSFGAKGFGISVEGKRTENFTLRTTPFASLNFGQINYLPPMSRVNTYRLTARYNPATQELGEQAFQIDVKYAPSRKVGFSANFTNITDLDNTQLYREIFTQAYYKYKRQWQILGGLQMQWYNQDRYEFKPDVPIVQTITPYAEFLYKFDRKKSIRIEAQYMLTDEDFGQWLFGLVEYSIAPKWILTISDMYNIVPKKTAEAVNYYTASVVHVIKSHRFELGYIKQVEGVVCSGGICRLEPAFNGVRFTLRSNF